MFDAMMTSNNNADWVQQVTGHVAEGDRYESKARYEYQQAANIIRATLDANRGTLNQKLVAARIGKSTAWVSLLLKWHDRGCPPGPIFAGEHSRPKKVKSLIHHTPRCGRDESLHQFEIPLMNGVGVPSRWVEIRGHRFLRV